MSDDPNRTTPASGRDEADPRTEAACCSPEAKQSCCAPGDKDSCCGPDRTSCRCACC